MSFSSKSEKEKLWYMNAFIESWSKLVEKIPSKLDTNISNEQSLRHALDIQHISKPN